MGSIILGKPSAIRFELEEFLDKPLLHKAILPRGSSFSFLFLRFDLLDQAGIQKLLQDTAAAAGCNIQPLGQGGGSHDRIRVHLEQTDDLQQVAFVDAVFLRVFQCFLIRITVIKGCRQ